MSRYADIPSVPGRTEIAVGAIVSVSIRCPCARYRVTRIYRSRTCWSGTCVRLHRLDVTQRTDRLFDSGLVHVVDPTPPHSLWSDRADPYVAGLLAARDADGRPSTADGNTVSP